MSKNDYYAVLGVEKSISSGDLKKVYHKLAMQYHPDRNPNDKNAEKKFKEITEAYDVLKDEQKRAAYDRFGHNAFNAGSNSYSNTEFHTNINDIFGDFFSDFMGNNSRTRTKSTKVKGSDLKYNLSITLEDAFKGISRNIDFMTEVLCTSCKGSGTADGSSMINCEYCSGRGVSRTQQGFFTVEQTCQKCLGVGQIIKNPCTNCNSTGRYSTKKSLLVNIPSGIEDGSKIKLVGEGEAGIRGGATGDLYIFVSIKNHDIFKVDGVNLHCKIPISFTKAVLGGEIMVPTIDNKSINLHIPAGTQNATKLRVKGYGMSKVRSDVRGDMFVQVYIDVPKKLSEKQKELLMMFDTELQSDNKNNSDSNFFDKMKSLWS